jgi:hypothetical protein
MDDLDILIDKTANTLAKIYTLQEQIITAVICEKYDQAMEYAKITRGLIEKLTRRNENEKQN